MEGRAQGFDQRFDALDQRMDRFEGRMLRIEEGMDRLDAKVDRFREELAGRIDALDQKISRHFTWTVGIQVAVLLAVVAALAGR